MSREALFLAQVPLSDVRFAADEARGVYRAHLTLLGLVKDEAGRAVFPIGGIRVLAYPAAHHAVADASGDHAFCYLNLRMGRGRSAATQQAAGQALSDAAKAHFAPLLAKRALGLTLQIDEGPEVFDAKFGNLHALFTPKA